jgi:hypothetical protein
LAGWLGGWLRLGLWICGWVIGDWGGSMGLRVGECMNE